MVNIKLDSVELHLKSPHNFTFLSRYGKAFWKVDTTGSGCVCIGMQDGEKRYFCKIAGADTVYGEVSPEQSIEDLRYALTVYRELAHPHLIRLIDDYPIGDLYAAIFEWVDGDCLFDHWNFDRYAKNPTTKSPKERHHALPAEKKLATVDVMLSFMKHSIDKGYLAVDLYDGSILYDFETDTTMLCDVDFFKKGPIINNVGEAWIGTPRLKAPEEYILGAELDEQTNIFTLGALIFEFFGTFSKEEIDRRYAEKRFVPCPLENWQLNEESYRVATRAVSPEKGDRQRTVAELYAEWNAAIQN